MVDVVLVKSDPIWNQSSIRAKQIINSLRKKYSVIALGWNRQKNTIELDNKDINLELLNFSAPYGYEPYGTIRLLAYFPIFWLWVFFKLCVYRPKVIHACDFATILPCYIYKLLFRKKLVFDVFDRYGMIYIPKNRNVFLNGIYRIVNSFEEVFAKNSDVLITVYDKMFLTFRIKPENYVTIMNCPEDHMNNRSRTETNCFKILFTGHLRTGRGLETLCNIVPGLKNTELIIAGKMKDKKLQNKIDGIPNINYCGFLDHDMLIDLEVSSDLMIALYDLNLHTQYEYAMPNKVLEAMMCGLPIVTNIAHELINETRCGIIVQYGNEEQIKEAIIKLRDNPVLRRSFGNNGRKAFLKKYNWSNMEKILFKIYEDLLYNQLGK